MGNRQARLRENLMRACGRGDVRAARRVLSISYCGQSDARACSSLLARALLRASNCNWINIVRLVCADPRTDVARVGVTPLGDACTYGYVEIATLLLTRVDPRAGNSWCLLTAVKCLRTDIVRVLLADARIDASVYDNAAYRYASDQLREMGHLSLSRATNGKVEKRQALGDIRNLLWTDARVRQYDLAHRPAIAATTAP
jgi:hypothetical protein